MDEIARNKYPEQTVNRILAASSKLFMRKGYDKTTMQDILDELKLSKGAIYHHFKSKEEILSVVIQHWAQNELDLMHTLVARIQGANGKEKLQNLLLEYFSGAAELYGPESKEFFRLQMQGKQLMMSGEFVTAGFTLWMQDIAPVYAKLIEEGIEDGSIHTGYPLETAEMLVMLLGQWAKPRAFDHSEQQNRQRLYALKDMLCKLGVDVFTDDIIEKLRTEYRRLYFGDDIETEIDR